MTQLPAARAADDCMNTSEEVACLCWACSNLATLCRGGIYLDLVAGCVSLTTTEPQVAF